MTNGLGERIEYTLDAMGNRTAYYGDSIPVLWGQYTQ
jgi:hypothetical protein